MLLDQQLHLRHLLAELQEKLPLRQRQHLSDQPQEFHQLKPSLVARLL
jgi:hypothetical protein